MDHRYIQQWATPDPERPEVLRHHAMWITVPCPQTCVGRRYIGIDNTLGPCTNCVG